MNMSNTEKTVKDIRRNTRRKFSTEEKKPKALRGPGPRIVLDGLRAKVRLPNCVAGKISIPTCSPVRHQL